MKFKAYTAFLVVLMMLASMLPAVASGNEVNIEFIDVTSGYGSGIPALSGEAKILVRATGLEGNATIAQTAITFEGNLKYKGIQYLIGENKYPECVLYYPDAAYTNYKQ